MCQQPPFHFHRALTLVLAAALWTAGAAGCAHYQWGSSPPPTDQSDDASAPKQAPDGPVVDTVSVPPDWALDSNDLTHATVRALQRHGAPNASRTGAREAPRLTCRLRGDHPAGFGRHHVARVFAHCQLSTRPRSSNSPDLHATGAGSVSTMTDTAGDRFTWSTRRHALRSASLQALSRAAATLVSQWHQD